MRIWGISALSHDAALTVIEGDEIVFASHSERYSRVKNDPFLSPGLLDEALAYGRPDHIAWYERPWLKKLRHVRAGQWASAVDHKDIPARYIQSLGLPFKPEIDYYAGHHESHVAAGFATSNFEESLVLTADAIGEFDTLSVSLAGPKGIRKIERVMYPHSLGLLYSAFTRRCGFRPNEDEYVVMGMASYGNPSYCDEIFDAFIELTPSAFKLKRNVHRGIGQWLPEARKEDLAASIQRVTEDVLLHIVKHAVRQTKIKSLILGGGVALNCVANSRIASETGVNSVWIFPDPGDAGSSLGSAAAMANARLNWRGPYLGHNIAGAYPVDKIIDELRSVGMCGVANGHAELGPRALGNRSLLADPRPYDMKDRVNGVKGREPFRPFAPVVREEDLDRYFEMPVSASPYMQYTGISRCPNHLPAITHADGTSRVQTVTRAEHQGLYDLLTAWGEETGVPVLLNTSLNRRSEPLVNTLTHARQFETSTGLTVVS